MDSFELNKILGAILFTLLVVMSLSIFSGVIYSPAVPEKPGFVIEVAEESSEGGAAPAVAQDPPIAVLLASAKVDAGEAVAKKCGACHNFVEGAGAKVGPDLYNVVDRGIGSVEGFKYSAPLQAAHDEGKKWTYEHLYHFLKNPKADMPGTAMGFAGLPKPEDRANLIAYLRTLAHEPVPLPAPESAAPAEATPAEVAPAPSDATPSPGSAPSTPAPTAEPAPAAPAAEPAPAPAAPAAEPAPATPAPSATPTEPPPAAPATEAPTKEPAPATPAPAEQPAAP
ncbi:c-type cytochrome [Kaistia defluvii]|uniref:Cytochrome c n=1 Tax=Kaistia defluvii TaxID=410841 RepID=A0ABV2R576_9HYPH